MTSPDQPDSYRESLRRHILDQLTDALLDYTAVGSLANPVLRVEAFLEDGNPAMAGHQTPQSPVVSKMVDLSGYMTPIARTPMSAHDVAPSHTNLVQHGDPTINTPPLSRMSLPSGQSHSRPAPSDLGVSSWPEPSPHVRPSTSHSTVSLRPAHSAEGWSISQNPNSGAGPGPLGQQQRQTPAAGERLPKRPKVENNRVVFSPQPSSLDKFVTSIWDQIHGGISLDPQSLLEQWQLTAAAATATINNNTGGVQIPEQLELSGLLSSTTTGGTMMMPAADGCGPGTLGDLGDLELNTFNRSNLFCRKVTQASRACRSIEVIVQARWIEHFDSHVEVLGVTNPSVSPTKRRKAALIEACNDFGWSEKELRNKMAIWRGYKEIKDAGGWAALVFAGMGLYRFCKYRVGFTPESMARLRALRPRIEVAADTLHPTWRQLLMIVGESPHRRFCGHPHDWVVRPDGSDPVPLRSTYLERDPFFSFEHLESESIVDQNAWGPGDDPRWVLPPFGSGSGGGESGPASANNMASSSSSSSAAGRHDCLACGQEQSEDPKINSCYCFPSLFGTGRRAPCPVQVFRTADGRNNGLLTLCPFERGAAIGEFLGLVTKGLRDTDVMDSFTGVRGYQVWQGRQGNFTRFVNHSCDPNAHFQHFVWLSTQRIVLVSKGIEAGEEITVDYMASYWRGLDKKCLCGEPSCRHK